VASPTNVAMDADGDFIVAWDNGRGGLAQRYDSAGVPHGDPIHAPGGGSRRMAVAMGAAGDFVLIGMRVERDTWSRDYLSIYGQAFNADGTPRGPATRVSDPSRWPTDPIAMAQGPGQVAAAMDGAGNYVISWITYNLAPQGVRLVAQRFDSTGAARGGAFVVGEPADQIVGWEANPTVNMNSAGDFVIGWKRFHGARAKAFAADGTPRGTTIHLKDLSPSIPDFSSPSVAMAEDGSFAAVWADEAKFYGRAFDAAGRPRGDEVVVARPRINGIPSLTSDADGDLVAAYATDEGAYTQQLRVAAPPSGVAGAWVGGSDWSSTFKQSLHDVGWGESRDGYAAYSVGGTLPLPWAGLDRITIRFNRDVTVGRDDLRVRGVNVPSYGIKAFDYEPGSRTATWTLDRKIPADRLMVELNGHVLGGEDFIFPLHVLPGDVGRDGATNALDVASIRTRQGAAGSDLWPSYSPFADLNGDRRINALDIAGVKRGLGGTLPNSNAAPATARSITRDLFGVTTAE
jgi:hypothetical protein